MQIEMWTKYDTKQTSYNPNMRLMVESEKKTTESENIEREQETFSRESETNTAESENVWVESENQGGRARKPKRSSQKNIENHIKNI